MLYCVPTFNNPTGSCLPVERCKKLIQLLRKHNVLALCDDVYNLLSFTDGAPPPRRFLHLTTNRMLSTKGMSSLMGRFPNFLGLACVLDGWKSLQEWDRCWLQVLMPEVEDVSTITCHVLSLLHYKRAWWKNTCWWLGKFIVPSATYCAVALTSTCLVSFHIRSLEVVILYGWPFHQKLIVTNCLTHARKSVWLSLTMVHAFVLLLESLKIACDWVLHSMSPTFLSTVWNKLH